MMKTFKLSMLNTSLLIALYSPVTHFANAEEAQSTDRKIEVIQVTAQKRSQSINEIPMAISAFNSDDLSEMGIEDTTDLAAVVPGFNYSETAFGPPVYTLRGVGFNESSPQATATVGVYVDEISVPFPIMTKGTNIDIERVEVLKGPQGTLYGRNSTAGAVNYIAAKPTDDFQTGWKISYSSFSTLNTDGFVSGALTDTLNARLALKMIKSNDGWQESVSRDDTLGEQDKLAARLSFDYEIGTDTKALLQLGFSKDNSDSLAPQAIEYLPSLAGAPANTSYPILSSLINPSDYPTLMLPDGDYNPALFAGNGSDSQAADWTADRHPAVAHETQSIALNITHEISDTLMLTSLTSYTKFDDNGSEYERGGFSGVTAGHVRNLTGGPLDVLLGGALANFYEGHLRGDNANLADNQYMTTDYVFQNGSIDSFSQELRVTEILDDVVWMAGVYYSKSGVDYATQQDWGVATNVGILPVNGLGFNTLLNVVDQDTTTYAVFANADWQISDQLTITTGMRYSDDSADYIGCTKDIDGPGAALFNRFFFGGADVAQTDGCLTVHGFGTAESTVGEVENNLNEDSLSWRFATNYELAKDSSIYASYSRGFKAGSFPSLAAVTADQLEPVVQEQLDAFEIGFKTTLAEGAAQLNGSAFYYDYKDKQLLTKRTIPIFKTAFTLGNMDKSTVKGLELDLTWLATDNLTINSAVAWLDSEIDEGQGFNQLGQSVDFAGSKLPFASDLQANIIAKYEIDLTDSLGFFVAGDAAYTSEFNTDFEAHVEMTNAVQAFLGTPVEVDIPAEPYEFDDRFTQDGYTIVNVRIGVENFYDNWRVFAWVRNLTDESYSSSVVKNTEMIASYSNMPRTFGVTFEMTWD